MTESIDTRRCESNGCCVVQPVTIGGRPGVDIRSDRRPADGVWIEVDEWRAFLARVKRGDLDKLVEEAL